MGLPSSIWWTGALKGALKETLRGLAIGFVAAAALFGVAQLGLASVLPMVTTGSSFSPVLLMAFCGIISGVTGLFTGGGQAVNTYHQHKQTAQDEAKIRELDGRTQALEQQVTHSPQVQKILERGPRNAASFETAETAREQLAATPPR